MKQIYKCNWYRIYKIRSSDIFLWVSM